MSTNPTRTSNAIMYGGLNIALPALSVPAGECIQLKNYEVNELGRYRRMQGFERFDGRVKPSESVYYTVQLSDVSGVTVGDTLTGGTSGATGYAVDIDATTKTVALVDVTGQFVLTEAVGGATCTRASRERSAPTDELDSQFAWATIQHYRSLVQPVPGEGPIRGVVSFLNEQYAFRDNVGQTECVMYKATSTGWTAVAGVPTRAAGGRYKFDTMNFLGSTGTMLLVVVDGVNKAFTFDGTTSTEITTGMPTDTPVAVAALPSKILALGYSNGSIMLSKVGDPTNWSLAAGAAEIAVSDAIVDLAVQPNNTLAVFCYSSLFILYGKVPAEMELTTLSRTLGMEDRSLQPVGDSIFLTTNGIQRLSRVQEFGDFQTVELSQKVRPFLERYIGQTTASFSVREKNQYRVCFEGGECLSMTFIGNEVAGCSVFSYGMTVRCTYSGLTPEGRQELFFGGDDGYVFQADKGNSLDGEPIRALIRPAFNTVGNPDQRKRFKKVSIEVETPRRCALTVIPEFDYSAPDSVPDLSSVFNVTGGGGYWGDAYWAEFFWSSPVVWRVESYIAGVAQSVSIVITSESYNEEPHTINSLVLHFSPRSRKR